MIHSACEKNNKREEYLVKQALIWIFSILLLGLSACAQPVATQTPAPTSPAQIEPIAVVLPIPTPQADSCVDCHTDKQSLIDYADPEKEDGGHGSESSGVG
jgi:hypothetical protein